MSNDYHAAARLDGRGESPRWRRLARLTGLAGRLALALTLAAGLLNWGPPLIADLLIRIGRPMVHLPVQQRIAEAAAAMAPRLFRPAPEADAIAEIERLAGLVPNAGIALYDSSGVLIWRSADFPPETSDLLDLESALAEAQHRVALTHDGADGHWFGHDQRHYFIALTPVCLNGRVVGGLAMRLDDTALAARMKQISLALLSGLLAGTAIIGGILIHGAARANRARINARAEVLQARNAAMAEQLRLGRQMSLLADLNEWLQSSRDLAELFGMVVRFFDVLLPGSQGSIYIYSNSRDVLDGAISWGGAGHHAHIHPGDCWALRRGRTYEYGHSAVAFACAHVEEAAPERYLCLPFLAHGETVGLLHVVIPPGLDEDGRRDFRRLAQTCAEQVSLAIANVRLRDELRSQAVRDPLTGLYNRRYMMDRLRSLAARRGAPGFALISIDIDHFKTFNDNHGHDAGDAVIRAVGEAMVGVLEGQAFACRCGGEELAIVLPEAGIEAALAMAEALRARVESTFVSHNGTTLPAVTVSVGVAAWPQHARSLPELLQRADAALYTAKGQGRNRVVSADRAEAGILSAPQPRTGSHPAAVPVQRPHEGRPDRPPDAEALDPPAVAAE